MNYDEIVCEIKKIIVQKVGLKIALEDINENDSLYFLGLDSVGTITLAAALEENFNIVIKDEDFSLALFQNISTLAKYIEQRLYS
ncbi:MAG: phosphopantetheine-binding protein [Melioribacteraceae bacterium]